MTTLSQEALEKSLKIFNKTIVGGTLFTLDKLLNVLGTLSPKFKKELAEHNITVQLKLRDNSYGRWFRFKDGFVTGQDGINKDCIVEMVFEDEASARSYAKEARGYTKPTRADKLDATEDDGYDEQTSPTLVAHIQLVQFNCLVMFLL